MNSIPETVVEAKDIFKNFGDLKVLKSVSITVRRGEVVAVIGPSGSGKSTLLRCINRLENIDAGSIAIEGQFMAKNDAEGHAIYAPEAEIRKMRLKMGMVFQNFHLFPHMNVMDNICAAPIAVERRDKHEVHREAMILLEKVGLAEKAKNYPFELSGGQKQRVAIARALAMRPDIMCFDEPTSALDPELMGEVLRVLQDLVRDDMTMLIVTHEMGFARDVADRVVFMDAGLVEREGTADEVLGEGAQGRLKAFLGQGDR